MIANAQQVWQLLPKMPIEQIRTGLSTFRASVSQTPAGRMNLF